MEGEATSKRKRGDGDDALASYDANRPRTATDVARMQEENNRLRNRCTDLEGTVALLKENMAWEYSAPEPEDPMAYWANRGIPEELIRRQAEHAELFFILMKRYVCQLRKGEKPRSPGHLEPPEDGEIRFDSAGLLHDEILLPHWKELARALVFYRRVVCDDSPLHVCIMGIQLAKEALDVLGEGLNGFHNLRTLAFLKHSNLIAVNEDFQERPSDVLSSAMDIIRGQHRLEQFAFSGYKIEDARIIHSLVDVVRHHQALHRLVLNGLFWRAGAGIDSFAILQLLLVAGGDRLRTIEFGMNGVVTRGSTFISDYLAGNPPLKTLQLAKNGLDDNDARMIASALKVNTNLRRLDLHSNCITKAGGGMLRKAIWDETNLNTANDWNNTCQIESEYIKMDSLWTNGPMHYPHDAAISKEKKMFRILSRRNKEQSNVKHLESDKVTSKEIPRVLERVQNCSQSRTKCLSVVYEIMRGWEMPSLYEWRRLPNTNVENDVAREEDAQFAR